ncbi:MAG: hypothetical protein HPAVJP_3270 [Candidatus Hepatoplasma vulgare]|nr:MAG: hypothetical protein HPAVJP_3270 [Candidatus Hepatoplasma sp.]
MKIKNKLFIVSFILFLPFLQIKFFGFETFSKKNILPRNNPYIENKDDSFTIIENSEGINDVIFEINIVDNTNQDFLNDVLYYEENENWYSNFNVSYYTTWNNKITENYFVVPLLNQSDIQNGIYRFSIENIKNNNLGNKIYINSLINFNLAIDNSTNKIKNEINLTWRFKNNTIHIPIDNRSFVLENSETSYYSTIDIYEENQNIFKIIETTPNSVTFTLKINNNSYPKNQIEVSLKDLNEQNKNYATKSYSANLINSDKVNNIYTYNISGLTSEEYQFISLNNTKLTLSNSKNYNPDNNIFFEEEIKIPSEKLIFETNENNPYIIENSFEILQNTATISSIEFTIKIVDNVNNDFYNKLINNNKSINISINDGHENIETKANWIGSEKPNDGIYTFKLDGLKENTNYIIISLNNTGLAISDASNEIDNTILIGEELNEQNIFSTLESNPYINKNNGFEIFEVTGNSVEFKINVINNYDNDFDPGKNINVTIKDSNNNTYQTTSTYVEEKSSGDNYVYEITELESGVSLKPESNYEIISLNNTGLAVGSNEEISDDEILIEDELNCKGSFKTLENNPYIEKTDGFEILDVNNSSVIFEIKVINNNEEDFDPFQPLNLTLKDSNSNIYKTTGTYINLENATNNYVYELNEIEEGVPLSPSNSYEIYSLNDTGLAVGGNQEAIDNEIEIVNELGENGNFITENGNPYIEEDNGFLITDITENSVKFQINVVNDDSLSFDPKNPLNVTIKNEEKTYETSANYLSEESSGNNYIYEITELEEGIPLNYLTNYEIISLNNTGLSVGNNISEIDDQIFIKDELNCIGDFTTTEQIPYITENGFKVDSENVEKDKIEFTINIINWNEENITYEEDLSIKMINTSNIESSFYSLGSVGDIYNANFISKNGNYYTYEINNLNKKTNYQIYSIIDPPFVALTPDADPTDEILISSIDNNQEDFMFATEKGNILIYTLLFFIILIVLLLFIISMNIYTKYKKKLEIKKLNKIEKDFSEESNF